jgi:phosphatidylglycerol:prolipoprotein diacylglycerol transferase
MRPILFTIGNVNFYSYGLMAGLAFLAFTMVVIYFAKLEKIYFNELFDRLIIMLFGALIGARVIYIIAYYYQFNNWYEIFYFWQGGLVSFGGMLGVIALTLILFKKDKFKWLDIFMLGFLAGLFFWRMGCFLAGDHPTVLSNVFFAINGFFPAILFESLLGLIGFIIFYFLYFKLRKNPGIIFFLGLCYYGAVRIFVDAFRVDAVYWNLKTGQLTGILLVIVGIIGIILTRKKYKLRGANE